jgi:crotonobetainyl-CoA:carnitine CoA-transferase CaiB-like acyl-CoA transferase
MSHALDGVRVLDFSQMMMGPWCTQLLGDLGADVIKVERPGTGDWERGLPAAGQLVKGESPFFLAMNRNKRSVSLDLKHRRAREVVDRLAKRSDLVVENYRPGVMDRLGFGYEEMRRVNPRIVYVSGSGYGSQGPYVDRPGQDLLIQALSGLAAYGGRASDPPTPSGTSIADSSSALMMAFSAVVGLYHAHRSGEGQRIEVDLFSTATAIQCQEWSAYLNLDKPVVRSRAGIAAAWNSAPYGIYRTADGYLALAMASLRVLGEILELPELAGFDELETAYDARDQVKEIIETRLATQPTRYWLDVLLAHDVWVAEVKDFDKLVDDPQLRHNKLLDEFEHPTAGVVRVVGMPMRMGVTPGEIRLPAPLLGQHTDEVLEELGYSRDDIRVLHEEGAV